MIRKFKSTHHRIVSINLSNVNLLFAIFKPLFNNYCSVCRIKCDFSSKFDFSSVNTYVCACILCECVLFFLNHFMCAVCLKRRTIAQIPFWKHYIIPSKYLVFVQLQWMLQSKKKQRRNTLKPNGPQTHSIYTRYATSNNQRSPHRTIEQKRAELTT